MSPSFALVRDKENKKLLKLKCTEIFEVVDTLRGEVRLSKFSMKISSSKDYAYFIGRDLRMINVLRLSGNCLEVNLSHPMHTSYKFH